MMILITFAIVIIVTAIAVKTGVVYGARNAINR
jgi:hypothetical protein